MARNIIYLSDSAFISILVAAIESFPSKYEGKRKPRKSNSEGEVFGLLFGQKTVQNDQQIFHVNIATPMQIVAERRESSIQPSEHHLERIRSIIEPFPMYQFLGTFHSHPNRKNEYKGQLSANYSETDKESTIYDAKAIGNDIIEMIIALTYLSKTVKKLAEHNWWNIENYCGNYKYTLAGYVTDKEREELLRIDNLLCPFASGLGNYDLEK